PPLPDSERPSRPLPGPSSGLELDVSEEEPPERQKQTAVFGTSDELEFDPLSGPHSHAWEAADSPRVQPNAPLVSTLDLEFPVPSAEESGAESRVESRVESEVPTLEVRPSSPPLPASPRAEALAKPVTKRPSVPPTSSGWDSFPGMGNEVELGGGFDDLDFGGAEAAQLNVAIPMPQKGDDIRWPTARTPVADELAVNREEVEEFSGFGPKPRSFLQA